MRDELKHYGVLGMKWGVRRGNVSGSYAKATKKLNKLNNKAEKAKIKYGKHARNHLTDIGIAKEGKLRQKSARAEAKAIKWKRAMDKEFSEKKLSKIEQKYINKGQKFLNKRDQLEINISNGSTSQTKRTDKQWTKYASKGHDSYKTASEIAALNRKIHS